ncbi:unnamed protein product, partial [Laminaria digitata]
MEGGAQGAGGSTVGSIRGSGSGVGVSGHGDSRLLPRLSSSGRDSGGTEAAEAQNTSEGQQWDGSEGSECSSAVDEDVLGPLPVSPPSVRLRRGNLGVGTAWRQHATDRSLSVNQSRFSLVNSGLGDDSSSSSGMSEDDDEEGDDDWSEVVSVDPDAIEF